jgi:hypothetical protein
MATLSDVYMSKWGRRADPTTSLFLSGAQNSRRKWITEEVRTCKEIFMLHREVQKNRIFGLHFR